ncbi:MAG: hypothetical protein K0S39_4925 [Paenibacillus sp.]|jgi:hypothetical protein|nr:hypothetical protein [Paenibacillus sp.]
MCPEGGALGALPAGRVWVGAALGGEKSKLYLVLHYGIIYNVVAFLPDYGGPLRIATKESTSKAE